MPETYRGLGLVFLYPETWTLEESLEDEAAILLESPEGAFMTITQLPSEQGPREAVEKASQVMIEEYEEVETEDIVRHFGELKMDGVQQRFIYLDLVISSQILAFKTQDWTYVIQIQGEDRDIDKLNIVFDAVITSAMQSLP
ncbi:MAG: hypothetical protein KDB03_25125 [Planctomycetales bacterium]|nr:hypothetical protein [Planctomycetales bacterium]